MRASTLTIFTFLIASIFSGAETNSLNFVRIDTVQVSNGPIVDRTIEVPIPDSDRTSTQNVSMQDVLHNEIGMSAEIVSIVRSDDHLLIDGEEYVLTPSQGNPDVQNVSFYAEDPRTLAASYEHHQVYGSSRVTREGTYNSLTGRLEVTSTRINTTSWSVDGSESSSTLVEKFTTILTDREPRILVQSAVLPENSHFFCVDTTRIEVGNYFERTLKVPVPGADCVWVPGSDCPWWTIVAGLQAKPEDGLGLSADILTVEVFDDYLIIEGGVFALTDIDGSGEEQSFSLSETEPLTLIGDASNDHVQFYESFVINGEGTFNRLTGVLEFSLSDVNKLTWNLDNSESVSTVEQTYSTVLPVAQGGLISVTQSTEFAPTTQDSLTIPQYGIGPQLEKIEYRIPLTMNWSEDSLFAAPVQLPMFDNSRGVFVALELQLVGTYKETGNACFGDDFIGTEESPQEFWIQRLSFDADLSNFGDVGLGRSKFSDTRWGSFETITKSSCSSNYEDLKWVNHGPRLIHYVGEDGFLANAGGALTLSTSPNNSFYGPLTSKVSIAEFGTFEGELVATYWYDTKTSRQYALDIINWMDSGNFDEEPIAYATQFYEMAIDLREKLYRGASVNLNLRDVEYLGRGFHGGTILKNGAFFREFDWRNSTANSLALLSEPIYGIFKTIGIVGAENSNPSSEAGITGDARSAWRLAQDGLSLEEVIKRTFNEDGSKTLVDLSVEDVPIPGISTSFTNPQKPFDPEITSYLPLGQEKDARTQRSPAKSISQGAARAFLYRINPADGDIAYIRVPTTETLVVSTTGAKVESLVIVDQDQTINSATLSCIDCSPINLSEGTPHVFTGIDSEFGFMIENYNPSHDHTVLGLRTVDSGSSVVIVAEGKATPLDTLFGDLSIDDFDLKLLTSSSGISLYITGFPTLPVVLEKSSDLLNWEAEPYSHPVDSLGELIEIQSEEKQLFFRLREGTSPTE